MTTAQPFDLDEASEKLADAQEVGQEFSRFMLNYQSALDEVMTKINILKREFEYLHDYTPIEHVNARLKSMESILEKARRQGDELTMDGLRDSIRDIAGIRVVCSFISDAYWIAEMLSAQSDVTVVEVKDYIAEPKPSGYKSLHLIVTVPIFLSESVEEVFVEIQIRTVAMDFWASLEHKIYYKFDHEIPAAMLAELAEAADAASVLDERMERLHKDVQGFTPEAAKPFPES